MESKILLGRILQRMIDDQYAQVIGYKRFELVKYSKTSITVTRENGANTPVPFKRILQGIEAYQTELDLYHQGPDALRRFGITHVNSPIYALLHLLPSDSYLIP